MDGGSFTAAVIGRVSNTFETHGQLHENRNAVSEIHVDNEYADGLYRLGESKYIQVLFCFDRSTDYTLKTPTFDGEIRGVFASRSPKRPSRIGVTTVELLGINENTLRVRGLDALNNTPVIDIKPYSQMLDDAKVKDHELQQMRHAPRSQIMSFIRRDDRRALLAYAGTFHGHYCPGIALGVHAATELMRRTGDETDGLEDTIAVIETNNCFSDGIQYVTGCTFGNNSLVYRDLGKTACSLVGRSGKGLRASVLPDHRKFLEREFPGYFSLFQRVIINKERDEVLMADFKKAGMEISFEIMSLDVTSLLNFTEVSLELPEYAPIADTVVCGRCGEGVMKTRLWDGGSAPVCISCAKGEFGELSGWGITRSADHMRSNKEK